MSKSAIFGDHRELVEKIAALGPWFHNLNLNGVETAPDHFLGDYPGSKWRQIAPSLPEDLSGRTVLDIGCNAGFHALEMKRRRAARVVGIDCDPAYLKQAEFAASVSGLPIELKQMSVYDIAALNERFDFVIFMGVLYHLRHPLLALDLIREHVARDVLLCQSLQRGSGRVADIAPDYPFEEVCVFDEAGAPRLQFVERSFAGDPTNWWVPNRACMEAMLRSAGFRVEQRLVDDVYLCQVA